MTCATVYVTSECNLRCKHCAVGQDQYNPRKPMNTNELKKIMFELHNKGTKSITILGGEATIYRDDMVDILEYCEELDLQVTINTNLTDYTAISKIIEIPSLKTLVVSLDGASSKTHDAMRGKGMFDKTLDNLIRVIEVSKSIRKDLNSQIAFTMSGSNFMDTVDMLHLANAIGVTHLNVKNVKIIGRAESFSRMLTLNKKDMLEAYSLLILNWMIVRGVQLEVFIPPSFASYLNQRFGLEFAIEGFHACGGINNFTYVDLKGNHLPCPAMAFEEGYDDLTDIEIDDVNIIKYSMQNSLDSSIFKDFEQRRLRRSYVSKLHPCNKCKFNDTCIQCVSEIIKGKESDTVDICSALLAHSDENLPGFSESIWRK